jgi:hypothetical protein
MLTKHFRSELFDDSDIETVVTIVTYWLCLHLYRGVVIVVVRYMYLHMHRSRRDSGGMVVVFTSA